MKRYNDAIALLRKEGLKNINFLNFMENNSATSVEIVGESVLLRGKSDRDWVYISCGNEGELEIIKKMLDKNDTCFGAIEDWMMPLLTKDKELLWKLSVVQYYLPANVKLPEAEFKTQPLSADDAVTVFENSDYKDFISVGYIKERILRGVSAGIYRDDKLAAWGMTQDDGAMGFLHVIDEYRRQGYGYNVTLSLIEQIRKNNKLPFSYIEEENVNSTNLVTKLGFVKDKKAHWFEIK